jgi:hypothetical protein
MSLDVEQIIRDQDIDYFLSTVLGRKECKFQYPLSSDGTSYQQARAAGYHQMITDFLNSHTERSLLLLREIPFSRASVRIKIT